MKKTLIVLLLAIAAGSLAFAGGNAEKLTTLDGTVLFIAGADGATQLMLRQEDGSLVRIGITEAELARLQLKEQDRLQIRGVYVGATQADSAPARILARTMTRDKTKLKLEEPLQLTEQDRLQIRACEEEQKNLETQNQTRTRTGEQTGSGGGSGASTDSGSGSGSGSGTGTGAGSATGKNK